MTREKLLRLSQEITVWGNTNFGDKKDSAIGVGEELGELCHCLLKRVQGIRGFDNPDHFKAQAADALADSCVYLLHLCGDRGYQLATPSLLIGEVRSFVARGLVNAACLIDEPSEEAAQRVLNVVASLASVLEIDLEAALDQTWAKVSKRNWVANPADAHKVAEASA